MDALLRRDDVDCVSIKVSSVAARLSLVDFEGSIERITEPLRHLYRRAAAADRQKLVNLDMEEHRDLDLTVESFIRVLDQEEFAAFTAGIALQAYLPDTHGALDRLLDWAGRRQEAGRAPIRIRLVKGANLAMENVEAEIHGWPPAPYRTKADTDASYVALLERLLDAAAAGTVLVGVASHNLFDVALALVLAEDKRRRRRHRNAGRDGRQHRRRRGRAFRPTSSLRPGHHPAGLPQRPGLSGSSPGREHHTGGLPPARPRHGPRQPGLGGAGRSFRPVGARPPPDNHPTVPDPGPVPAGRRPILAPPRSYVSAPDTDLTVPANRSWAVAALARPAPPAPPAAAMADIDAAVDRATEAGRAWSHTPADDRGRVLDAAADVMEGGRADAVAVMASEAGKTFAEADPEASEGIDYARWYGAQTDLLARLEDEVASEPCGVVVVSPPWNFPYAIPAGGVLAAVAAGNPVLLENPVPRRRPPRLCWSNSCRRRDWVTVGSNWWSPPTAPRASISSPIPGWGR